MPTVATGRGFHTYARLPGGEFFLKLDGGDVRADRKRYAVLPPSRHPMVNDRKNHLEPKGESQEASPEGADTCPPSEGEGAGHLSTQEAPQATWRDTP